MRPALNKAIREKFLQYHTDEDLKLWFDPLVLSCPQAQAMENLSNGQIEGGLSGDFFPAHLQVDFPHRLFAEWFKTNYKNKFEEAIARCYKARATEITYASSNLDNKYSAIQNKKPGGSEKTARTAPTGQNEVPVAVESAKTFNLFSDFIYNAKNEFPVASAKKFASGQGRGLFIIYGANGYGKSHILEAIYSDIKKNVTKKIIFFSNLYELETFFSNSFKKSDSPLSCLTAFEYLLLDDAHNCSQNSMLQESMVRLLEFCAANSIHCALALNAHPSECALMDAKLRSLMESGLVLELKKPDLDVRAQYVFQCAGKLNFQIKKDDAVSIARMYDNFRQIHGAMLKIAEFNSLSPKGEQTGQKDLRLEVILKNTMPSSGSKLTPDHIINCTASFFKTAPDALTGKARQQDIVLARHIAMFLCRDLLGVQFSSIGNIFKGRDHSSVLYSVNKIKKLCKTNKDMNNMVSEVKNMCVK